jgi:hypothetical protein
MHRAHVIDHHEKSSIQHDHNLNLASLGIKRISLIGTHFFLWDSLNNALVTTVACPGVTCLEKQEACHQEFIIVSNCRIT